MIDNEVKLSNAYKTEKSMRKQYKVRIEELEKALRFISTLGEYQSDLSVALTVARKALDG